MASLQSAKGTKSIGGPLGAAMALSLEQRIKTFIVDSDSDPLRIYGETYREQNHSGDWYGEHAGKWLAAATLASRRTGDQELAGRVSLVAEFLAEQQESSGYLGNYATGADSRIESGNSHRVRTWDLWVMACNIRGLTECGQLEAAGAIAKYILTCAIADPRIAYWGNHEGLSAGILIDPLMDLYRATNLPEALTLSNLVLSSLEERLNLLEGLRTKDVSAVGTGKIYQLCWLLTGLAKLEPLNESVLAAWQNIRACHLTPLGGPWGGVARHKEVFNDGSFFSPEGLTETCSTMAWLQLNAELYRQTGGAEYAEEAERALLNALLGALHSDGENWSYFTFPNGRRNATYYWACCKSSGALALEEASFWFENGEVAVWVPFENEHFELGISEDYQSATLLAKRDLDRLRIRIPSWSSEFSVDKPYTQSAGFAITNVAQGDVLNIHLGARPNVISAKAAIEHHGHEIARTDYFGLTYGPWVYATGPERYGPVFRLSTIKPEAHFRSESGAWHLNSPQCGDVRFEPYFRAGGREDGRWRAVWHQVDWQ